MSTTQPAMTVSGWKQRLLMVGLSCALGLAVAFAFAQLATYAHPCGREGLSCSMTQIVGLIYMPVFAGIALLTFAVATLWKNDATALTVAALVPLVPLVAFATFTKYFEMSVREFGEIRDRDIDELLQIYIPIVLTIVVPWALLWRFAAQAKTEKKAHG